MARRGRSASRKDVAELAGVSPSTVSLVLNKTPGPRIPEGTCRRVIEAARKLEYRPSSVARALASGRTMTVGVVLHYLGSPFGDYTSEVMNGFWGVVRPLGYRLLVDEGRPGEAVSGLFRERVADGLMVLAPPLGARDAELAALVRARFPVVFVGARPREAYGDYADLDNFAAARLATRALVEVGHTRILHITGPTGVNSSAVERLRGYEAELESAGIGKRMRLVVPGDYGGESGARGVAEALDRGKKFTAVFAATAGMARAAIRELERRGIRAPDQVSVTGINLEPPDRADARRVVTVRQPLAEIGAAAARMLAERLGGFDGPPREMLLPGELVRGDTVAPPGPSRG